MTPAPRLYEIRLYAVICRKVTAISAATPAAAVEAARESATIIRWLDRFHDAEGLGEFGDEISHYLVDVVGDHEFQESRWFHDATTPLLRPLRELLDWDETGRDPETLAQLLATVRQILQQTL